MMGGLGLGRSGPSLFRYYRPGQPRPMTLAARRMRPGLYTGRPTRKHGPARVFDEPDHRPAHVLSRTINRRRRTRMRFRDFSFPFFSFGFHFPAASGPRIALSMRHTYLVPAHVCSANGPLRWTPPPLVDNPLLPCCCCCTCAQMRLTTKS